MITFVVVALVVFAAFVFLLEHYSPEPEPEPERLRTWEELKASLEYWNAITPKLHWFGKYAFPCQGKYCNINNCQYRK